MEFQVCNSYDFLEIAGTKIQYYSFYGEIIKKIRKLELWFLHFAPHLKDIYLPMEFQVFSSLFFEK